MSIRATLNHRTGGLVGATIVVCLALAPPASAAPHRSCHDAGARVLGQNTSTMLTVDHRRYGQLAIVACSKATRRLTTIATLREEGGHTDAVIAWNLAGSVAAIEVRRLAAELESVTCATTIVGVNASSGRPIGNADANDACAGVETLLAVPSGEIDWTATTSPRAWGGSGSLTLWHLGVAGSTMLDPGPVDPSSLRLTAAGTPTWTPQRPA